MVKSDFSDEASYQSNDSLYVHLPEDLLMDNKESEKIPASSAIQKMDELIDFIESLPTHENIELVDTDRFTILDDYNSEDDSNSNCNCNCDCDITDSEEKQMLKNEQIRLDEIEKECKKLEEEEEETIYI